jgi:hypothetical protein
VILFPSPKESLLPFQGSFRFDVVGDSEKTHYKQFGVESFPKALLNPRTWALSRPTSPPGLSPLLRRTCHQPQPSIRSLPSDAL